MQKYYWSVQDLVTIGIFAAMAKVITLCAVLITGGMNPVGLIAKNVFFTMISLILLYKVQKQWTFLLFILVSIIVNTLFFGASIMLFPPMIVGVLCAEYFFKLCNGYSTISLLLCGVFLYDTVSKIISVFFTWLFLRENAALFYVIGGVIGIGYLGSIIGIFLGKAAIKELRCAGILKSS